MRTTRRITGIGALRGHRLLLTLERSRACGHWEGEGGGGSPEAHRARAEVRAAADEIAAETGCCVEIEARHPAWGSWMVDVVDPPVPPLDRDCRGMEVSR